MDTIHITTDADALRSRAAELISAGRIAVARPLLAAAQALGEPSAELTLVSARIATVSNDRQKQ